MAASPPQTFHGVTPERYARLAERARSAGIPIEGNTGSAAKFGIELTWTYSPDSQELTIQCLRTPFFLSPGDIEAKISALVQQSATA